MLCDCLDEIGKIIKEQSKYKKEIKDVEIIDVELLCTDSELQTRTISHIEVRIEGQKKKAKISILHTFCPFCGKKQACRSAKEV